jgi:tetratricopeptide (TPR) repeat protein
MYNNKKIAQVVGVLVVFLILIAFFSYQYRHDILSFFREAYNKEQPSLDLATVRDLMSAKKYEEAIDLMNQMEKGGVPLSSEYYRIRYVAYNLNGEDEKSRIAIRDYLDTKPGIAKYWISFIDLEKAAGVDVDTIYGHYEDAVADVSRNTNVFERVDIFRSYASYLTGTGKYDEAITYLKKAEEIDDESGDFYESQIQFVLEEQQKANSN